MRTIRIEKTYKTLDELNNSQEYKDLYEGFQMTKARDWDDLKFKVGYLGNDGNIYTINEVTRGKEKGLRFLNQCSVYSMLTNNPFMVGMVVGIEIFINDGKRYSKCAENRELFAKRWADMPEFFLTSH
jgi:hypothetical protein